MLLAPLPPALLFPLILPIRLLLHLACRLFSSSPFSSPPSSSSSLVLRAPSLNMTSTVTTPSLPPHMRDPASFRSELRKQSADYNALQQEVFDLRMQVSLLRRVSAASAPRPSRPSLTPTASPLPERFYDADGADSDASDRIPRPPPLAISPTVSELRHELTRAQQENASLQEKTHALAEALDDLREESVRREEELGREVQLLTNQAEDSASDRLAVEVDITRAREARDAAERELEATRVEGAGMAERERTLGARVRELEARLGEAEEVGRKEGRATREAIEKMGRAALDVKRVEKDLEELGGKWEEEREKKDRALKEVDNARAEVETLRVERDMALVELQVEKEGNELREEGGRWEGKEEAGGLDDLLAFLQKGAHKYRNATEYHPRWREVVLEDYNTCLTALYRSQKEIEQRRREFVTTCVSDPALRALHEVKSS